MTNLCPCCGAEMGEAWPRIDLNTNTLILPGGLVRLPPKGAELYKALVDAFPQPLSTRDAIAKVWGLTAPATAERALAVHLYRLREQLGAAGYGIDTLHDKGYRLLRPGVQPTHLAIKNRTAKR